MAVYVIMGMLAAFGCMCALWILLGAWRSGPSGGLIVYRWRSEAAGRAFVLRCRIARDLGLSGSVLIIVDPGMTQAEKAWVVRHGRGIELCSPEALAARLELETNDGTGNGDHPGCHQRRGLPEL